MTPALPAIRDFAARSRGIPARQAIGATFDGGTNETQREIIAKANGL
jgi:hypothetical protein